MKWQTGTQNVTRLDDEDEEKKSDGTPGPILKHLLESRTVLLTGPVTDELSQKILAQLLVLDAQDAEKPIRVYINSPGGSVDAGYAIYDAMRFVRAPVHAIIGIFVRLNRRRKRFAWVISGRRPTRRVASDRDMAQE